MFTTYNHPSNRKIGASLGTPIHATFAFMGIGDERYAFLTFTNVHDVHDVHPKPQSRQGVTPTA